MGPDKRKTSQSIHDTNIPDEEHNSQPIFKKPDYAPDEEKQKDFDSDNDVVNDINVPTQTISGNAFFYMGSFPSVSYPYVPGTLDKYPVYPKTYWCCLCKSGPTLRGDRRISVGCGFCNTWAHKSCIGFSRFSNDVPLKVLM